MPFRPECANEEYRRRFILLDEPILRITVKPSGMVKIDALIRPNEDRTQVFDFYTSILTDIRAFDTAIRDRKASLGLEV